MKRQEKYPETKWFHYFNANPKNRVTGDCRIRAIATATGLDYNVVVLALAVIQIKTGYDQCADQGINILMKKLGWERQRQPRKPDGTKYTGKQFCDELQKWLDDPETHGKEYKDGIIISPRIFCNIGGHHEVAIVDGKVWDIWDSTDGCIGNYWIKW